MTPEQQTPPWFADSTGYRKCDGDGEVCLSLSKRLGNGHQKGFNSLFMVNFKSGEELTPILVYKSSPNDNGICLNFCPFCGSELNLQYRPKV